MPKASTILITGFLGSGKTTLAKHLRQNLGTDPAEIIEVDGLMTAETSRQLISADPTQSLRAVVAVADAANFTTMLKDRTAAALITAQIVSADSVVVTRSDAADPKATVDAVKALTDQPILVAPHGQINPADLPRHNVTSGQDINLTQKFETWSYAGPATLQTEQAEALLERRPKGIYRIAGQVKTDQGGLDLQLIGRARQVTKIEAPDETRLFALGPKANFQRFEMDGVFATYAAASAHLSGLLGHR